jgi:LPXTG-motif cell wall-anchored protein
MLLAAPAQAAPTPSTSGRWAGNVELVGVVECNDAPSPGAVILWTLANTGSGTINIDHAVSDPAVELYDGTFGPTFLAPGEGPAISAEMVGESGTYVLTVYGKAPGNSATASGVVNCGAASPTTSPEVSASASPSESGSPAGWVPDASASGPGSLPVTGTSMTPFYVLAGALLAGGLALMLFGAIRLRRARFVPPEA